MNPTVRSSQTKPATLYVIATPIGNLKDITLRALEVLQQVSIIACEDTRHTKGLMTHYNIKATTIAVHGDNEQQQTPQLLKRLHSGIDIAYVSDAGTPSISDPGSYLVAAAHAASIPIVPIPGASAVTAALSVAGCTQTQYTFHGFLPKKTGELVHFIKCIQNNKSVHVCFLSARQVEKTICTLADYLPSDTHLVLAKEMTKIHETIQRGTVAQMQPWCKQTQHKGEYVLLVHIVHAQTKPLFVDEDINALIAALVYPQPLKTLAPLLMRILSLPKNDAYNRLLAMKKQKST